MYKIKSPRKNSKARDIASPASPKRKRIVLNYLEKEAIIKKMDLGYSHQKIASDFNIGVLTVYKIYKMKKDLSTHREENSHSPIRKKF